MAPGVWLLNVPVPEVDHVAEEAPPPKLPAITAALLEQMLWAAPAETVAALPIVSNMVPTCGVQGASCPVLV
jgi:hypothetical protein